MAVREGFEPSIRCRIHTFQACSFSHSDTSPIFDCAAALNSHLLSLWPKQVAYVRQFGLTNQENIKKINSLGYFLTETFVLYVSLYF